MKLSDQPRRLHPLTLVQRLVVSLPALVFILIPVFTQSDGTAWFNLVIAAVYAAFLLPWIAVYYLRFRFWITPKEIVIHSGVLTRRKRNIPIERIQNIEIEQALLQRVMKTAKVAIYTAGTSKAEGVLEYVSIVEAREIRATVRHMQEVLSAREGEEPSEIGELEMLGALAESQAPRQLEQHVELGETVFEMSPKRVALAGIFHFSWLYIAGMFSLIQYVEPDPTVFFAWLIRGPLEPWGAVISDSPFLAVFVGLLVAIVLGWGTGALVTFNKYFRFKATLGDQKLHRQNGLMTLSEGTTPLKRIQSLVVRTNALMQRFDFYRLELQTLGTDVKEAGFQVVAPFAKQNELNHFISSMDGIPLPTEWMPVSRLTIRRFVFRNALLLLSVLGLLLLLFPELFPMAWLGLGVLPAIVLISILRFNGMGYALQHNGLAVRSGIFFKVIWLIPFDKAQTFFANANYFQRRLGLMNLYVDTAGASSMKPAEVVDLSKDVALGVLEHMYRVFKQPTPLTVVQTANATQQPDDVL